MRSSRRGVTARERKRADIPPGREPPGALSLRKMHTRKIPIILRKKNDRSGKCAEYSAPNIVHTFFEFSAVNVTLPSGLNTSPGVNFERATNRLLHRQRKQLHNPLETHDSNNNRNKKARVGQTSVSRDSVNCDKNASRRSNSRMHSTIKKSKNATIRKTNGRKTVSCKTSSSDTVMNTSPSVAADDFFNTDAPARSSDESNNTPSCENGVVDIATTFDESSNFCYSNETSGPQGCYDVNSNPVFSEKPMEPDAAKRMFEKDCTNFSLMESMDNNGVNNLFDPEMLHPCAHANCTSCNEGNTFFNDSLPSIDDMEMENFTSYVCADFPLDDYDHILGETWLQESVEKNLCCENIREEMEEIAKENDGNGFANTVENKANVLGQSNLQPYSAGVTCSNGLTNCLKSAEDIDVFNEENPISQDETLTLPAVLAETSVSNDTYQPRENKKGLYFIQCTDCKKVFKGRNQFRRHFTRCTFLKEENNFDCTICLKKYKHKSSLSQHLKIVHKLSYNTNEHFYVCTKCSKSYVRLRSFQRHKFLHEV